MFTFWLKKALKNIKRTFLGQIVCLISISLSLSVLGIFMLAGINVKNFLQGRQEQVPIIAFFQTPAQAQAAQRLIREMTGVKNVSFVSSQEAIKRLKRWLGDNQQLLQGLNENPLLPSVEIQIQSQFLSSDYLHRFVSCLKKMPGVVKVVCPSNLFLLLSQGWTFFGIVVALLGLFLGLATIFIIANLLHLHLYKHQEEIQIMRLLGASETFIKMPFFIEGIIQGVLASSLALVALWKLIEWFNQQVQLSGFQLRFTFFNESQIALFLSFGLILSFIGSFWGTKS